MEKNSRVKWQLFSVVICCLLISSNSIFAQEPPVQDVFDTQEEYIEEDYAAIDVPNITLDFKEADIRNVLRIISLKSGVNIVAGPEVVGLVTIRLEDVPWNEALDAIVKTYGFGYVKKGSIIIVAPLEKLAEQQRLEAEFSQTQAIETKVFHLKFLDAKDVADTLESLKSERGKITVLKTTGQAGWQFGTVDDQSKRDRLDSGQVSRSKILMVTDVRPVLDKMEEVLAEIDVMPQQISIETKIIEINRDHLRDFGFDWGTGASGAESSTIGLVTANKTIGADGTASANSQFGAQLLSSDVSSSVFGPKSATISGAEPFNAGFEILYKKLTGTQFEAILHALEEDISTNTLSAPRILTLDNQEASILVGTRYPFLKAEQSTTTTGGVLYNYSLDKYQDIGIQLNVVPQISGDDYINLIVHPAVTSFTQTVKALDSDGATLAEYPIIITREVDTQILIKNGETIVIGGLLKDVQREGRQGVPVLGKIPVIGWLFQRKTYDTEKIDLLIFITAKIVDTWEISSEELSILNERLEISLEQERGNK
ncbi:MAG TPA: type IV pilus secretin PilQ [Candidatus Omnitrophica bacterium]|nr:type IV pilus secretin PilQ [Candidatus Omnitrophota bacterium]